MEIKDFPFPLSANHLHISFGRGRRRNSDAYIAFQHECRVFHLANRARLKEVGDELKGHPLSVHFLFYSPQERLFCKDGTVKRYDHHNLLKSACDALGLMLGIDDRMFFEVSCVKLVGDRNRCDIQILEL